ncbi:MAG: bifunctional DNA primase/polymerase [Hyphomonadaceae bacterium]
MTNATLDIALGYARRGWRVVPVERGGKKPFNADKPGGVGWQHLRATEDDLQRWFGGRALNVGVLLGAPSGGLVDIDLDANEAIALAGACLPETNSIFGREGKPKSHWLYCARDLATRQFVDPVDGVMLVEIRSTGAQTVFPGSTHASGDAIEWAEVGEPAEIQDEQLSRGVSVLATAALLARHWPGDGGRHDAQLTLIGFLTRCGWSADRIGWFAAQVIGAGGGEADPAKRRATALDAARRLADGRAVRGLPKLAETFGEKVARAVSAWLGAPEVGEPATQTKASVSGLALGSHVELARAVICALESRDGAVVHCEGEFWTWSNTHWRRLDGAQMRREVHKLDGSAFPTRGGGVGRIRMTRSIIDSVISEMAAMLERDNFFDARAFGVNCASGFLLLGEDGAVEQVQHHPEQRQRYLLPGRWSAEASSKPPAGSLLNLYLERTCGGGLEGSARSALLAEVAGVAALGAGTRLTQPKAIVLFGPTAANGKSALLDMLRALVSPDACASISPRRLGDDRHLIQLLGKVLNAADELGGEAIASDVFKQVVTGELVTARDVYKRAVCFRPQALHVFACNELPHFRHGLDRGLRRRLLPIPMNVEIARVDRIPDIGRRIGAEEVDVLLAWAIDGARRVLAQGRYSDSQECEEALRAWANAADPVAAWLNDPEETELVDCACTRTKAAYVAFRAWAETEGYVQIPPHGAFTQRIQTASAGAVLYKRDKRGAHFCGLNLRRSGRSDG